MGYVYLMERPGTVTYADIVDENIEPAEPFEAGRDHARRVGGIGDIARNDQPLAAEFAHEIESRLCPTRFEIEEGDARAFGGDKRGDRLARADALAAHPRPGDERAPPAPATRARPAQP